ncbi:hypothetical protein DITRI_Ditri15bG0086000 [Diplodiscus trichospermus]
MTTIHHANLACRESLLQVPANLSKPKKKWHSILTTIYCSRTFLSLVKSPTPKEKTKAIPCSSSHASLTITQENSPFRVDQTTLVELVKEKKIKSLQKHDGVDGVASALGTDPEVGISGSAEDIACRHEAFGSNTYKKPPTKSFFHFVVEAFKDLTIMILFGCAALSLSFGIKEHGPKEGWYVGGSIFVAAFLVIAVSAISNYRQNRQFDKLSKVGNNIQIDVVRGGRCQQISIFDIVVGDIVCLKIGDQVPADGLFLDGQSLQVDESTMTGGSDHVEVNCTQNPFLLSGTKVGNGYARMLVTVVGMNTTWGQMMSHINRDTNERTPLQARLNKLTSSIAAAVSIVVVAIPEGLLLAVTRTLAYSMKRMMANQAMVRKLSACETMGSSTTICTDKIGTLTLNRMKVTKFWLGQESMEEGASSISPIVVDLIHQGVALNATGCAYRASSGTEFEFSGSPTEKAILSWAVLELKMDMEKTKRGCAILQVEAFNSQKKRSGVLIGRNDDDTVHIHWKGAAERILSICSSYYDASGNVKDLNNERTKFDQIIQGMAASSLRCIAFAHKQIPAEEYENLKEQKKLKEDSLTLLGLVGINYKRLIRN